MTRAADRLGLLVWSEIPVYWAVEFSDPAVLAKAKGILHEEIDRDRNRASIALWSVANETPNTPARTQFLTSPRRRGPRGRSPPASSPPPSSFTVDPPAPTASPTPR